MNDREIVSLFLRRDETALAYTADIYGARLRALAFYIVQDGQAAEECENDTYLRAWDVIPPHEPWEYFYPFLAKITRQLSLNRCRHQQRLKRQAFVCELSREMEECLPSHESAGRALEEAEFKRILNTFLGTLSNEKRQMFVRRYWYLDSVAAIAARYGVSQSKVKTTLFRVREQFRRVLEKEGYDV